MGPPERPAVSTMAATPTRSRWVQRPTARLLGSAARRWPARTPAKQASTAGPCPPPPSAFVDNVEGFVTGFVDIGSAKTKASGVGGTRNAAAKARAQASNRAAGRGTPGDKKDVAPVVVTVPLGHALDKPIMANLDANHQIESIRSEGSWVPKGDHI